MRVDRAVDSTVKESLRPAIPAQSGIPIPLVFMPEDRVFRMIVRKISAHVWILDAAALKENESHQFPGRWSLRNRDPLKQRLEKR